MVTVGLAGVGPPPPEQALPDLRRRLGPGAVEGPVRVVAGPLGRAITPGVRRVYSPGADSYGQSRR